MTLEERSSWSKKARDGFCSCFYRKSTKFYSLYHCAEMLQLFGHFQGNAQTH